MAANKNPKYWFPAKRYGWGWGTPTTWQGWAVFLVYAALVLGGIPFIQAQAGDIAYFLYLVILTIALQLRSLAKGRASTLAAEKRRCLSAPLQPNSLQLSYHLAIEDS